MSDQPTDRRQFLAYLAALSAAGLWSRQALAQAEAAASSLDEATIDAAAALADLQFTAAERALMHGEVQQQLESLRAVRALALPNALPPALRFRPDEGLGRVVQGPKQPRPAQRVDWGRLAAEETPAHFASLRALRRSLDRGELSCLELTRRTLDRLRSIDSQLHCVIELTEERALDEAKRADAELAAGKARGPLHGIPYGAKDLLAARGAKTTWGARPFAAQTFDEDADVVRRLAAAGAILVAKTSVGALAWGDVWFDATTRNPWDVGQGSSGSSAGSASAVAAGALSFAIGTETLGSLVSPSTRCGVTAIRPTFGRVSRGGCMALSWSMDKIGPMARSVADAALVLDVLAGAEARDPDSVDRPLHWPDAAEAGKLRVGFVESAFASDRPQKEIDAAVLDVLRKAGLKLTAIELPDYPVGELLPILGVEAAAAFEELTLSNRDDELVRQVEQAWPNIFRAAHLVPAVQYVQAQRARTELMRRWDRLFENIDVFVCPSFGSSSLAATNLTGHPTVVLPNGFREDGHPTSICFTAGLYREGDAAAIAHRYQAATEWHLRQPTL